MLRITNLAFSKPISVECGALEETRRLNLIGNDTRLEISKNHECVE